MHSFYHSQLLIHVFTTFLLTNMIECSLRFVRSDNCCVPECHCNYVSPLLLTCECQRASPYVAVCGPCDQSGQQQHEMCLRACQTACITTCQSHESSGDQCPIKCDRTCESTCSNHILMSPSHNLPISNKAVESRAVTSAVGSKGLCNECLNNCAQQLSTHPSLDCGKTCISQCTNYPSAAVVPYNQPSYVPPAGKNLTSTELYHLADSPPTPTSLQDLIITTTEAHIGQGVSIDTTTESNPIGQGVTVISNPCYISCDPPWDQSEDYRYAASNSWAQPSYSQQTGGALLTLVSDCGCAPDCNVLCTLGPVMRPTPQPFPVQTATPKEVVIEITINDSTRYSPNCASLCQDTCVEQCLRQGQQYNNCANSCRDTCKQSCITYNISPSTSLPTPAPVVTVSTSQPYRPAYTQPYKNVHWQPAIIQQPSQQFAVSQLRGNQWTPCSIWYIPTIRTGITYTCMCSSVSLCNPVPQPFQCCNGR